MARARPKTKRKAGPRAALKPKSKHKRIWANTGGRKPRELSLKETKLLERIGRRIKVLRVQAKLTAAKMGESMEFTQSIEYRRESGSINFPVADLLRYARFLKCKPADLLK
jgi:hypothetical protein